jgi:acyl-CoA thioester hydrolase
MEFAGGSSSDPVPFSFGIRVYWEDTDAGGVVYHASYLRFLERARTEWLRAQGFGQQALRESEDLVLVVRDMAIDFRKPARLDDELLVSVVLAQRRSASLLITQEISRGDQVLVRANVRVACLVASSFRPRPLPEWLAGGQ